MEFRVPVVQRAGGPATHVTARAERQHQDGRVTKTVAVHVDSNTFQCRTSF